MPSPAASVSAVPAALVDTGVILALVDRNDNWHERCVEAYDKTRLPLLTTQAVLTEVFHLVGRRSLDHRGVWRLLRSGAIQTSPITNEELPLIKDLMDDYADRPMDFADATLVSSRRPRAPRTILTIDHDDFETYRLPGRKKITILPPRRRS
jgi:uncharacterized protein